MDTNIDLTELCIHVLLYYTLLQNFEETFLNKFLYDDSSVPSSN